MITSYFQPVQKQKGKKGAAPKPVSDPEHRPEEDKPEEQRPNALSAQYNKGRSAIAAATLDDLKRGSYVFNGTTHDLAEAVKHSLKGTRYYPPDSGILAPWASSSHTHILDPHSHTTTFSCLEISTLEGGQLLANSRPGCKIGILNFASATKPGGGFINGASAQEESIARSSALYPTLMTDFSQRFYKTHKRDNSNCFYSHAMIYSPQVMIFRNDNGSYIEPYDADILTSAAVNAGVVRKKLSSKKPPEDSDVIESKIEEVMKERMGRILFLFERARVRDIVLGSFGTGVFKNNITMVATLWANLLCGDRYRHSFDTVIFAILGNPTFVEFSQAFEKRRLQLQPY